MDHSMSLKLTLISVLVLGFLLVFQTLRVGNDATKCSNKTKNALRGMLILGVMSISISATLLACSCCLEGTIIGTEIYLSFIILFGIVLTTLASIIHSDCKEAKAATPLLITAGVLMIVLPSSYLGYTVYTENYTKKKVDPTLNNEA